MFAPFEIIPRFEFEHLFGYGLKGAGSEYEPNRIIYLFQKNFSSALDRMDEIFQEPPSEELLIFLSWISVNGGFVKTMEQYEETVDTLANLLEISLGPALKTIIKQECFPLAVPQEKDL